MAGPAVCMLSASFLPSLGGTERQCWLLSEWLTGAGVSVAVLTRAGGRGLAVPPAPFAVHRVPVGGAGAVAGLGYVLASACWLAARGGRFNVLHAHQALSPALAAVLAKRLRPRLRVVVKLTSSGRSGDLRLAQGRPFYRRRMALLRAVDRFVVLNSESAAELEAVGLGAGRTCLIPNGVDVRRFVPAEPAERTGLRSRLGIPQGVPVALFVGRLERRKGLDILLAAWADLLRRGTAPHLLIAGPGDAAAWGREANALGLRDRITFLGGREDVADLYRAADLFVFPSRGEGCSNAVLEAMASALPVVLADVAGNREAVREDGKAGWLVPAEDPAALARILTQPGLAARLGRAARKRVETEFSLEREVDALETLYREIASGRGREARRA